MEIKHQTLDVRETYFSIVGVEHKTNVIKYEFQSSEADSVAHIIASLSDAGYYYYYYYYYYYCDW